MSSFVDPSLKMNDLEMSEASVPLFEAVKKHIEENVKPIQEEYEELGRTLENRWSFHPRQLELLEGAKNKAKEALGRDRRVFLYFFCSCFFSGMKVMRERENTE